MEIKTIKLNVGVTRKKQLEEGYFDGRFKHKIETPKNIYSRKTKHKKNSYN